MWKIHPDQEKYFLKTFEIAIKKMSKKLRYVSDIMFSYFHETKCGDAGNGDYLGSIVANIVVFASYQCKRIPQTM